MDFCPSGILVLHQKDKQKAKQTKQTNKQKMNSKTVATQNQEIIDNADYESLAEAYARINWNTCICTIA